VRFDGPLGSNGSPFRFLVPGPAVVACALSGGAADGPMSPPCPGGRGADRGSLPRGSFPRGSLHRGSLPRGKPPTRQPPSRKWNRWHSNFWGVNERVLSLTKPTQPYRLTTSCKHDWPLSQQMRLARWVWAHSQRSCNSSPRLWLCQTQMITVVFEILSRPGRFTYSSPWAKLLPRRLKMQIEA